MFTKAAIGFLLAAATLCLMGLSLVWVRRARRAQERAEIEQERLLDEIWELKSAAGALDRAEAANEAKSRFLATVSHEFRTPLNGILGMTDLLASTSLTAEQSCYLEAIRLSGASLSSLIDEILDFSKIEAGKLELKFAPFDLPALVEGIAELLAPRAQGKGIEIASWVDPRAPRLVVGDAVRLGQVLLNLAGNAVKFTREGGVGLRLCYLPDGSLRFSVADTGPGIPLERRQSIFLEFEQADSSSSRRHEGTGLGLAISRRLVDLMGGELRLEQAGEEGSIFAFAIDLPRAPTQRKRDFSTDLRGKSALVISASPFGAPFLIERLAELGVEVTRAEVEAAAVQALEKFGADAPDLVIVDCAFGEGAAQRLAEAARAVGAKKSFVLFSPFERRAFGEAIVQDFDGWLVKPIRLESLSNRLNSKFVGASRCEGSLQGFEDGRRLAGLRILLAEDNDVNALLVERRLRISGAEVFRAHDGAEAVALACNSIQGKAARFDAVLMDIRMPKLDGLEAARLVRAAEAVAGAPPMRMIALTANAFDEDRQAAFGAGLDDFLTKPIDLEAMVHAIVPEIATRRDRAILHSRK
ncbi:ATP-binding protein [uncultured Rhodoblastus sp.]|uniref:ATP-binding protein n=1 Tax=uncultured Rhodoblastus sp. TaxID=543037 RepID=UPI0025DD4F85|nr:ATP-binding protein [uncultured Rhodoblastus sp.]